MLLCTELNLPLEIEQNIFFYQLPKEYTKCLAKRVHFKTKRRTTHYVLQNFKAILKNLT